MCGQVVCEEVVCGQVVCEEVVRCKLYVDKLCVSKCVCVCWAGGRADGKRAEAGGSAQPKTRTPHKDVGNSMCCGRDDDGTPSWQLAQGHVAGSFFWGGQKIEPATRH